MPYHLSGWICMLAAMPFKFQQQGKNCGKTKLAVERANTHTAPPSPENHFFFHPPSQIQFSLVSYIFNFLQSRFIFSLGCTHLFTISTTTKKQICNFNSITKTTIYSSIMANYRKHFHMLTSQASAHKGNICLGFRSG